MCEHIHLVKRTLSDREAKSNVAEGSSVVFVNIEENEADLPNSIHYTISASKTENQQNLMTYKETSPSRTENQHNSILNEISPPRTVNHHQDLDFRKKFQQEKIQDNDKRNIIRLQKFDHFENILKQASKKADT